MEITGHRRHVHKLFKFLIPIGIISFRLTLPSDVAPYFVCVYM